MIEAIGIEQLLEAVRNADTAALVSTVEHWGEPVGVGKNAIVELIGRGVCYEIWFQNPLPTIGGSSSDITLALNVTVNGNGHDFSSWQLHGPPAVEEFVSDCNGMPIDPGDKLRYTWYACFTVGVPIPNRTLMCSFQIDECDGNFPFIEAFEGCGQGAHTLYAEPPQCSVHYPDIIERTSCNSAKEDCR